MLAENQIYLEKRFLSNTGNGENVPNMFHPLYQAFMFVGRITRCPPARHFKCCLVLPCFLCQFQLLRFLSRSAHNLTLEIMFPKKWRCDPGHKGRSGIGTTKNWDLAIHIIKSGRILVINPCDCRILGNPIFRQHFFFPSIYLGKL